MYKKEQKKARAFIAIILAVAVCATFSITAKTAFAVSLPGKVPAAPAAVPWASATASGQTVIYVRWGRVPGADGYLVCRDGKRIIRTSAKATVFKQRGMAPGKRYGFTVRAFKKFYQRQWYNKATGRWQASKPPASIRGANKIVTAFVYSAPSAMKYATTKKKKAPKRATKIMLTKLTSLTEAPRKAEVLTDNYGKRYAYAMQNETYDYKYEYLINKRYKSFKGTIYIPKGEKADGLNGITIKGDGRVLYVSPVMKKISRPVNFNVNITGVNRLTIEWDESGYRHLECCIANPYLYYATAGSRAINLKSYPIQLKDLTSIDSEPRFADSEERADNFGNTYNWAVINRYGELDLEYIFNGKYRRFTGILYIPRGATFNGGVRMTVISDGVTLYTSPEMTKASAPVRFNIDVRGRNHTEVIISGDSYWGRLCLAYPYLYQ